jgi:hypothetical protein
MVLGGWFLVAGGSFFSRSQLKPINPASACGAQSDSVDRKIMS